MVRLGVAQLAARRGTLLKLAAAAMFPLAWAASPAHAEMQIGVYGGWSESFDSDIHLSQPGGTNLTLNDVPWDGDSFEPPPYWGLRGTYWLNSAPSWGLMLDYNHAKVIADQGAVVSVTGTRDGVKRGPKDRVGDTFQVMEFTDGLNEIFFGGQYRWIFDRWTPYVGVRCRLRLSACRSAARWAWSALYLRLRAHRRRGRRPSRARIPPHSSASRYLAIISSAISNNDAYLKDGGSLQTDVVTNHFIFGVSYRFGGAPVPEAPY